MGDQINILEDIDINTPVDIEKKLTDILVKNNTNLSESSVSLNKELCEIYNKYSESSDNNYKLNKKVEKLISENSILIIKNTSNTQKIELMERLVNIKETLNLALRNSYKQLLLEYESFIKLTKVDRENQKKNNEKLKLENQTLKQEISEHKKTKLCKICYKNPINIILFPCGHITCCKNCKDEILLNDNKCPLCRADIQDTLQIYYQY